MKNKSRKFSIFAAILILLAGVFIGGYLVLNSRRGDALTASQMEGLLNGASFLGGCEPNANDSEKDSDYDGLKDWQEIQIYHSEACKADTDGDGYLDGEEIASGYDPTKKSPGDELPGTQHDSARQAPIDYKNANLTELLAQTLSQKVIDGKFPNFDPQDVINADSLESNPELANALWEILPGFSNQFFMPEIADEEIKIIEKENSEAKRMYLYRMSQLFQKFNNLIESRGETKKDALNEFKDNNDFTKLQPFLDIYIEIYNGIKNIECPSSLKNFHKEELSFFKTEINALEAIKNIENDPLKTVLALRWYEQAINQIINIANRLEKDLKN